MDRLTKLMQRPAPLGLRLCVAGYLIVFVGICMASIRWLTPHRFPMMLRVAMLPFMVCYYAVLGLLAFPILKAVCERVQARLKTKRLNQATPRMWDSWVDGAETPPESDGCPRPPREFPSSCTSKSR